MRADRSFRVLALGLVIASAAACAPRAVPAVFQDGAVQEEVYRVAPADVLVVRVWKSPELSVEAPVLPDGTLTVPLVGAIPASGLTTEELEDAIAQKMSEYITAPDVSIIVSQVNSKRVSMIGEVVRGGSIGLAAQARIMDALSNSGGFTPFANKKKVRLIRATSNGDAEFVFDYDAYVRGRAPGTNVLLQAGDVIVVPD